MARQILLAVAAVEGHRFDLAGARLDDVDSGRGPERVVQRDGVLHRLLRGGLDGRVERGRDRETPGQQLVLALLAGAAERRAQLGVLERPADVVAEERGADRGVLAAAGDRLDREQRRVWQSPLGAGLGSLGLGDEADGTHPREHRVTPRQQRRHDRRVLHCLDRVEAARGLHDARQQRPLGEGELLRRLAEVEACRRTHAVDAVAVVGDVQVSLEDLVLGEFFLDRQRVAGLFELAVQGDLAGRLLAFFAAAGCLQQGVLDVLLGQRGPALADAAGLGVLHRRPQGALVVDAVVGVEARVLGGDDGLAGQLGDVLQRRVDTVLPVEDGQLGCAVGGEDAGALG